MSNISYRTEQLKTLYKNNLWQGRLLVAALITLLVLVVVRISLPYTIVYSTIYWLNTQGVVAQIEDISINVNKGTFTVTGATGSKNGISVFNVGKASIDWEWRPLAKKTMHIKDIILEDFSLESAQFPDALVIAGIVIRDDGTIEQQASEEGQQVDWGTSLNQIDFKDLGFCFQQFDTPYDETGHGNKLIDYCGNIDQLTWQGDFSLANVDPMHQSPGHRLLVEGTLHIEQLHLFNNRLDKTLINIGGTSLSNININGINDIRLDSINMSELMLLQGSGHSSHKHAVEFSKLDITGISITDTSTVSVNTLAISKPIMSMAMDEAGKYKYELWLLHQGQASSKTVHEPAKQPGHSTAFNLKLGNIRIIDAEICYEQLSSKPGNRTQALDYCLNLATSEWKGSIAITTPADSKPLLLSLNGNLALSRFITTNKLLRRDLLNFENLAINKIALNSLDDLAFGKLELDNASGLELTSDEDKHAMTVASLDVTAFSYRNNTLAIDRVAINDLGLDITRNEDGTLDFKKWKIATTGQQATDKAETKEPGAEPVKIKLGEFSLNTTRLVEFTDLSVTPNMLIGLKEIRFNIKDLDSDKPMQKSPLELSAKTTRHGTVEIKGVAMPFEAKPSFDASGKITGLDLRAASPKAEQVIGHIIKSGQMDADLKLLSTEGRLNSNIALVLHHFNLKAKSKEDAAALDEAFGIPINQSLMLLKDKKGRIKLNIPITGDINNPSFDPADAIIKATAKATTVTLITFYTPYGLAYAGGNVLFNLATAMNFEPLTFDAGSSQLTDVHVGQLSKLAELLVERPAVHLTLCGLTNLNDREKLFTEIIDRKNIKPPSAERLKKLKQLGAERQENVKNQLVSVGKITHDRLILCEPDHNDDAESIAGVEISI